jgi:hypothetical protein
MHTVAVVEGASVRSDSKTNRVCYDTAKSDVFASGIVSRAGDIVITSVRHELRSCAVLQPYVILECRAVCTNIKHSVDPKNSVQQQAAGNIWYVTEVGRKSQLFPSSRERVSA